MNICRNLALLPLLIATAFYTAKELFWLKLSDFADALSDFAAERADAAAVRWLTAENDADRTATIATSVSAAFRLE